MHNGHDQLFEIVGELARRRFQLAERRFAALGLTHTEARLLSLLHQNGGQAPQDALTSGLHIDRTNGGRALQRLERDGFVVREAQEGDRRAKSIRSTALGRKTYRAIAKLRAEMAAEFCGALPEPEAASLAVRLREVFR